MKQDISVIVPYYNEAGTILTTLDLISKQTFRPKEIIFVDSGSTDRSYEIIEKWYERNSQKLEDVEFINLKANTGVPSSSKNEGIRVSKGNWVAFMDCGLLFSLDWLEKQVVFLNDRNFDVVSGGCYLVGIGLLDCSAVAQTYGYKRFRPSVPSSLVKKSVFDTTGLFLEGRRSGYDVDWVNRLSTNRVSRGINKDVIVRYNGMNYAKSLKGLFLKSINYAESTVGIYRYYYPYVYIILVSIFLFFLIWNPRWAGFLGVAYLVGRGYCVPLLKSRSFKIVKDHPFSLLTLPVAGFAIDMGKLIGFSKGFFQKLI